MASRRTPGVRTWWWTVLGVGTPTLGLLVGPASDLVWQSPLALFWIVTVAASLCVVAAAAVLVAAHRRDLAEAGVIGTGLMAL